MAQYNLGRCFPVVKGNYDSTLAYVMLDIVFNVADGCSYICKNDNKGQPLSNSNYWVKFAESRGSGGGGSISPEDIQHIIDEVSKNIGKGNLVLTKNGSKFVTFNANSGEDVRANIATLIPMRIDNEVMFDHSDVVIDKTIPSILYKANIPIRSLFINEILGGSVGQQDTEISFTADKLFEITLPKGTKWIGPTKFEPGIEYLLTLHMGYARLETVGEVPIVMNTATE